MKGKKNYMKRYWWIIAIAIFIIGLPILLNFLVFMPVSQLSVGTLHDWMSFWGSYLGATISALAAFVILYIQRKDHQQEIKLNKFENKIENGKDRQRILRENQQENAKSRKLLSNFIAYQQEAQWLNALRGALINCISICHESEIKNIINSLQESSFELTQQKIKVLYDTIIQTDTNLSLLIAENNKTSIKDENKKELQRLLTRYLSILKNIQLLTFLYFKKAPISHEDVGNLNNMLAELGIESKTINYKQFCELANQIITPLSDIFNAIQVLSQKCIKGERMRIDSILN